MANTKLGIDTLVLIGIYSIEVVRDVKETQRDGFQLLPDISTIAFKDFGKIQTVASSWKNAWAEIKDLDPEELAEFEARVADGAKVPNDGVQGKVRGAFRIAARAYAWGEAGIDIFEDARDLLAA